VTPPSPPPDPNAPEAPALRAVLLGASNLRAALPLLFSEARRRADGPVEVLAALGQGRSYGTWSRYLFLHRLPGIAGCGLWPELARRPPRPTLALLTDVGNDLAYGQPPERIAGWIETCLDRLEQSGAHTVLTLLPLAGLEALPAWRFRLAGALFFPGRELHREELLDRARWLQERLRRAARERGAAAVELPADWYGLDPIHFRRSRREGAWSRVLQAWPELGAARREALPRHRIPFATIRAAESRLFGVTIRGQQPAAQLNDGSKLFLF
jgi:hypothetical protein